MPSHLKAMLVNPTSIFGLRLWILILTLSSIFAVLLLTLSLCFFYHRRRSKPFQPCFLLPVNHPISFKNWHKIPFRTCSLDRDLLPQNVSDKDINLAKPELQLVFSDEWLAGFASRSERVRVSETLKSDCSFTLSEIMLATNGFSDEIGKGPVGVVYSGVFMDNVRVAIKNLMVQSCKAEDFVTEAEEIGTLRHKNVIKLLGYCVEAVHRSLIYEFVENGNLHQWLHGSRGQASPLSWKMRMNIIHGIAKGNTKKLAYLHEDIEPKIVHQGVKSSNILLDHQWNPKISDVALPRFLGPNVCGTIVGSGYVSKENAFAGELKAENDVYSFGILIMEIVSGRLPIDHSQPKAFLIDWLKWMVGNQKIVDVVDPKMPELPSTLELKRVILVALRCVDSDIKHRPKMGDIIYMLEPHDMLLKDEFRLRREASRGNCRQESNEKAAGVHTRRSNFNPYESQALV